MLEFLYEEIMLRKSPYRLVGLEEGQWAVVAEPVVVPGFQPGVKGP